MARLVYPDDGDVRRIDAAGRMLSAVGRTALVYSDAAATILADIRTHPGGAAITGSALTVSAASTLPLWQGPDTGVDTLYVRVDSGPVTAVYARTDDRLDTVAAAVLPVGTTAGTVAAGDDSRIAGALQAAANLSDVADAATARANLGITSGGAAVSAAATYQTSGNITTTAHATATAAGVHIDIPAVDGDTLVVWRGGLLSVPSTDYPDMVVLVSESIVWRASTGSASAPGSGEGDPCLYPDQPGGFRVPTAPAVIPVTAGLLDGDHVRVDIASNGAGGTVIHAGAYPGRWTWIRITGG